MITQMLQRQPEAPQEQLLELYWNRAGVKRELAGLRRERYQLLDKLKEQEGAIVRAQEQLEGLERLLTNPLSAANAMVYFQLRRLWRICALRLEQFGSELQTQRERRERAHLHDNELSRRQRRLSAIRERVADLTQKRRRIVDEARQLEDKLARTNVLLRLFKGRQLRSALESLGRNREMLDEKLSEFSDLSDKIQGEPLPEPEELSVESRRMINTALVALAQQLVVHFAGDDLAMMAKRTTQRSVADMKFGDRGDCDRLVEQIRAQIEDLRRDKRLAEKVRCRADQLAPQLTYRNETDVVPTASSVAGIQVHADRPANPGSTTPARPPLEINVLADNYWDVRAVLR